MLQQLNKRLNLWNNFTKTMDIDYPFISKIDRDIKWTLKDLLLKGNKLQRQLNILNLKSDFQFKQAMRIVNLQEMIMNEIIEFRKEIINYQKAELKEQERKEKCKKQSKTSLINLFQMN